MALEFEGLTGAIKGAALDVRHALGPGFLELVYEEALAHKLAIRGIVFARQVSIPVRYQGSSVGVHKTGYQARHRACHFDVKPSCIPLLLLS